MNPDAEITISVIDARGWPAVYLVPRGKRPSGPAWTVEKDPAIVARWFDSGHNAGLFCGSSTAVVLDPDDMGRWADMICALGQPSLPWVLTGSGRLHYYVAWEPDLPAKLTWDGAIIGEILRGPNQQAVLPGSVHPSGEIYRWIRPELDPLWEPIDYTTLALPTLPDDWLVYLRGTNGLR